MPSSLTRVGRGWTAMEEEEETPPACATTSWTLAVILRGLHAQGSPRRNARRSAARLCSRSMERRSNANCQAGMVGASERAKNVRREVRQLLGSHRAGRLVGVCSAVCLAARLLPVKMIPPWLENARKRAQGGFVQLAEVCMSWRSETVRKGSLCPFITQMGKGSPWSFLPDRK